VLLGMAVAIRYHRRSSTTPDHVSILGEVAIPLQGYCLLLRPFGRDGATILPAYRNGRRLVYRTTNLESVVADTARRVLGVETIAVVDQRTLLCPPGPTYFRAPDDGWQDCVQHLIRNARVIVLILPIGQEVRKGFHWELEQITRLEAQRKLVLLLPPIDQTRFARPTVVRQANLVMTTLLCSTTPDGFHRATDDLQSARRPVAAVSWDSATAARQWHIETPRGWRARFNAVGDETYVKILSAVWREEPVVGA
jgi:hypothetical protein